MTLNDFKRRNDHRSALSLR